MSLPGSLAGSCDVDRAVAAARAAFEAVPWTGSPAEERAVAATLRCCTVWINDCSPHGPAAERGGRQQSGVGGARPTGLAEYRELRHVWRRRTPVRSGWVTPPTASSR